MSSKLTLFTNPPCSPSVPPTQLKQVGSSAVPASADQTQEVGRLRGDLEKKTHMYEEEMTRREGQHSTELKALRKELREAESQNLALQKEILMLKDKLEKTRRERYAPVFSPHDPCLHVRHPAALYPARHDAHSAFFLVSPAMIARGNIE